MKRLLKKSIAVAAAVSITATGFTGLPAALAATDVTLSSNLAEYTKAIQVTSGGTSWQWYSSTDAAGTDAKEIEGAASASYTPTQDTVGSWIYCVVDGTDKSDLVRVVASSSVKMEKVYKDTAAGSTVSGNFTYCNLGNTEQANYPGTVLTTDWTVGGTVEVVYSGINEAGNDNANIPTLRMNTWGYDGYSPKNVTAVEVENEQDGNWKATYKYEDMLAAWSGDQDFIHVLALQAYRTGTDTSWGVVSAKYTGPTFDTSQVPTPTVKLSDDHAVYGKEITATIDGAEGNSWQWYISEKAAGTNAETISGATSQSFTPQNSQIGGWLFCEVNGYRSEPVRVLASEEYDKMKIEYISAPKQFSEDSNYINIQNTAGNGGAVDPSKWAVGGRILIEYSGLTENSDMSKLPLLRLNIWSVDGYAPQAVQGSAARKLENGNIEIQYDYNDMLEAWYNDKDFSYIKALQAQYSGDDKTTVTMESVVYVGPPLSFGDTLESVSTRGGTSTSKNNRYLFTAHVGGAEFDPTRMRENSYLYLEYAGGEDAKDAFQLNLQSMSDGNSSSSTYATLRASEHGKTGSGWYSKFMATDIQEAFAQPKGSKLRMLDRITISLVDGKSVDSIDSVPALYFYEGSEEDPLLDDIGADGYERAVDVHWTKYDDTDKNGIVVIGASISQNPLVTPAALEGHPYYAAQGGWNAVLDRTDAVTFGIGSQTTTDIAARFHEILSDKYDYDTIIMQCGNNDLGAFGTGEEQAAAAAQLEYDNYCSMMNQVAKKNEQRAAEGKEPIRVYIIAINNVNSRENTNVKIQAVVEKLDTLEQRYNFVTYIEDINEAFRPGNEADPYAPSDPTLVMTDGLHPVAAGYAIHARFLKPLLASKDESDASLVSLSWRADRESRKYPVEGFESRAAGEYEYTDQLSEGTPDTIRLYITPNNLAAAVEVTDGTGELELKSDLEGSPDGQTTVDAYGNPYGNNYVEVDMSSGSSTVVVSVTSVDGSQTSTFTVNLKARDKDVVFAADDVRFDVNDDIMDVAGSVPYKQIDASVTGTGLVLSYDVEVENLDFAQDLQIRVGSSWNDEAQYISASEFDENYIYHVERSLEGEASQPIKNVIVTFNPTDYRGTLTIKNIEVKTSAQGSE